MPLFLVRWPNRTTALVQAQDELVLFHLLDQQADPYSAMFMEYTGPVWVEFSGPDREQHGEVEPSIPATDNAGLMSETLVQLAFPRLAAAFEANAGEHQAAEGDVPAIPEDVFETAIGRDVLEVGEGWRSFDDGDEPVGQA